MRVDRHDLSVETLVQSASGRASATLVDATTATSERRQILELVGNRMLSIAELSAYLHLPLGVTKVLIGDLLDEGVVAVHRGADASLASAANLKVLESVLNGISAL